MCIVAYTHAHKHIHTCTHLHKYTCRQPSSSPDAVAALPTTDRPCSITPTCMLSQTHSAHACTHAYASTDTHTLMRCAQNPYTTYPLFMCTRGGMQEQPLRPGAERPFPRGTSCRRCMQIWPIWSDEVKLKMTLRRWRRLQAEIALVVGRKYVRRQYFL